MVKNVTIDKITYELDYPFATVIFCDKDITFANIRAKVEDCVVNSISEEAFAGCQELKDVYIDSLSKEEFLKYISADFSIGDYAFNECTNLKEIYIPMYYNEFGRGAFRYCAKLSTFNYNGEAFIGEYCFASCKALESVNVCNLPEGCFSNCRSLKKFIVSDKIDEIETDAFEYCANLEYVYIPKSVKHIGQTVFRNDFNLKKVEFEDPKSWEYTSAYHDNNFKISFDNPEKNAKLFMSEDFDDGVLGYNKIK